MKLGIFGNRRHLVAFLCYGEAYGLIQHDKIREFLLFYYTHIYHLHTRGTWTAQECVDMDRERAKSYSYCIPAQMTIPIVTKWMLVFEDPLEDKLWLAKATPRDWLKDGETIGVEKAPTKWGNVSYRIVSKLSENRINVTVKLPERFDAEAILRLRLPDDKRISSVCINGQNWQSFDSKAEIITLPGYDKSNIEIKVDVE